MEVDLYDCPHCGTEGVLPAAGNTCPHCRKPLGVEEPNEVVPQALAPRPRLITRVLVLFACGYLAFFGLIDLPRIGWPHAVILLIAAGAGAALVALRAGKLGPAIGILGGSVFLLIALISAMDPLDAGDFYITMPVLIVPGVAMVLAGALLSGKPMGRLFPVGTLTAFIAVTVATLLVYLFVSPPDGFAAVRMFSRATLNPVLRPFASVLFFSAGALQTVVFTWCATRPD